MRKLLARSAAPLAFAAHVAVHVLAPATLLYDGAAHVAVLFGVLASIFHYSRKV